MGKLIKLSSVSLYVLFVLILSLNSYAFIDKDTQNVYCNGNSIELVKHYQNEILFGKASTTLILSDVKHIEQILGFTKTISLLHLMINNTDSEAEKSFITDMVSIFEEQSAQVQDNKHIWNIYDNTKEPMPKTIALLQLKNDMLILPNRNKFSISQNNGYIPLDQYTQNLNSIGLCSSSFIIDKPFTICIFSNMDYVLYINGRKMLVNALTETKRIVRMVHITPYGGCTIALYYKPVDDMFLKVLFRDDNNSIIDITNTENIYYTQVQCNEVVYEYLNQLLIQYTHNPSPEAILQLALFFEAIESYEALQYYKELLNEGNEFVICRYMLLLLRYTQEVPGLDLLAKKTIHLYQGRYSSPLWHNLCNYLNDGETFNVTRTQWLPLLLFYFNQYKKKLIVKNVNFDSLLAHYPQSSDLCYYIASITSYYDVKKAINQLETIKKHSDKTLTLLLQLYMQDSQYEKVVTLLNTFSKRKFFNTYIDALIALKEYNTAKRILFKSIVDGFDTDTYNKLAKIAELQGYDGSMYMHKYFSNISHSIYHSDYMKETFDDYVKKVIFSRLGYELISSNNPTIRTGLLYSCFATRMVHNTIFCTIYDLYFLEDISTINDYTFNNEALVTNCTVYIIDSITLRTKTISLNTHNIIGSIKEKFNELMNKFIIIKISFNLYKDFPLIYLRQNFERLPSYFDIIAFSNSDITIRSDCSYTLIKDLHNIHHFFFIKDQLSPHDKNKEFLILGENLNSFIEWLIVQDLLFKRFDFLAETPQWENESIEDVAKQVATKLHDFSYNENPYMSTSIIQFTLLRKGTALDAMFYARYVLAKNGVISYVALGMQKSSNPFIYQIFLYIPLSSEQGLWLTPHGICTSLDKIQINTILFLVGNEVIAITK